MKVKELIDRMKQVNPEAEVEVIVDNRRADFKIVFGGGDGCTKKDCSSWGFMVGGISEKGDPHGKDE